MVYNLHYPVYLKGVSWVIAMVVKVILKQILMVKPERYLCIKYNIIYSIDNTFLSSSLQVSTPGTTQPPNTPETQSPDSQQPTTTTKPPVETQPDKTPSKPPREPIKPTIEPNSSLVDNRAPSEETNHKGSDPKEPKKGTHQKLEKPTEGLLQAQNEQNIDIPNQTVEPERVEIVSLDVADFEDPSEKRSGGYLTYNRWRY